ncbi:LytR/AlgR family response regulator transcription factor [Mongoliitalea daihaiensis]|uniref:LytR/AlgR family response regulator transcription factor n=1 Tax=Mongoliitalea daihaiensis TaxID=2782006 RepID=UPI001F3F4918|nr:LytTR family DNA-binding domain-containing protein [Mongoliitalea daihaiensis]UJP64860.1 response regulator transcription factor [Mongoliitalea daihaiensis]
MKIKCIAVDDEPLALELVCKFINQTSFLELKGRFDNAIDALQFINNQEIELIFLDIQMPDLSGMELARIIDGKQAGKKPKIVFTTAYNQFAIEGYKVDALDYLLKPFSYEEFLKATSKAYEFYEKLQFSSNTSPHAGTSDFIFLKVEYQLIKVMLADIMYVEAYKDYVKVHLKSKANPLLSLTSMKNMEELLPASDFLRVHRSTIVNIHHIDSISKNMLQVGDSQLAVSEHYKEGFMKFMDRWMK